MRGTMKKSLFFLALGAVLFASCNKEMTNPDEPKQEGKVVNFTINVGAPETKTYFEHDDINGKYIPKWNNGDALGVFFNSWTDDAALAATFTNTAASGTTASFSGTGTVNVAEQTIYAFYPANSFAKAYNTSDGTYIGMNIPQTQRPTATSFDPKADILVNVPYAITIDDADVVINDMQFRRVGSVLKVVLIDGTGTSKLDGDNVKSLTLATDMTSGALSGRYRYDFVNERPFYKDGSYNEHMAIKNADVTADLTANPIALNGTNAIFVIVNPCKLDKDSHLNLSIVTDKHNITKEITLPKDISFPVGAMAEIQVSIKDTDDIDDVAAEPTGNGWYLVQDVSWLHAGDKVVITSAASDYAIGTQNSNNRAAVSVSVTDGKLNVGTATQFDLAAGSEDGTFAFKSGDNYLNAVKGNNYLKSESTSVEDISSWTITISPSLTTIFNVGAPDYEIQKNKTSAWFSCYKSTQNAVLIYKKYSLPELAALSILVAGDDANKKIEVTWSDVANATNYAVECTGQVTKNIAPGVEYAEFTGLEYDTEYTITVTASAEGYAPSSASDAVTLTNPAAKVITRLKASINDVPAAGVTDETETGVYSLTNATDGDLTVTPDGTFVTAASASGGSVTYTVAANTGGARSGSITIAVAGGNSIQVDVNQLAGASVPTLQYTLDGTTTGGDNGYATDSAITQDGIDWVVTGNTTMSPWRIGGKSLSAVDRVIYSESPISENISKIVISHGAASSITVNSMKVYVCSTAAGAAASTPTNVVASFTPDFVANDDVTINKADDTSWANCYYRIVYNVTVTVTSNKFLEFKSAKFYGI